MAVTSHRRPWRVGGPRCGCGPGSGLCIEGERHSNICEVTDVTPRRLRLLPHRVTVTTPPDTVPAWFVLWNATSTLFVSVRTPL